MINESNRDGHARASFTDEFLSLSLSLSLSPFADNIINHTRYSRPAPPAPDNDHKCIIDPKDRARMRASLTIVITLIIINNASHFPPRLNSLTSRYFC